MSDRPETLRPHERWWQDHAQVHAGTFRGWLEDSDPWSRGELVRIVETLGARSVLECGPGLFHDYETYWKTHPWVQYRALEMTPKLVAYGSGLGATVAQGSVTAIPCEDRWVDVAYCRHVLEHLHPDEINTAALELARVSRKAAVIVLFRWWDGPAHAILEDTTAAPGTYCNTISVDALRRMLDAHGYDVQERSHGRDMVLNITPRTVPAA